MRHGAGAERGATGEFALDAENRDAAFADDRVGVGAHGGETVGGTAGDDDKVAAGLLDEGSDGFAGVALLDEDFDLHAAGETGEAFADGGFKVEFVGVLDVEADVAVQAGHGVEDDELGAEAGGEVLGGGENGWGTFAQVDGGGDFAEVDVFEAGFFHMGAGEDGATGVVKDLGGNATEEEAAEGAVAMGGKDDEVYGAARGVFDDLFAGEAFEEDALDGHGGELGEAGGVEAILGEFAAGIHEFLEDGAAGLENGSFVVGRRDDMEEDGLKG